MSFKGSIPESTILELGPEAQRIFVVDDIVPRELARSVMDEVGQMLEQPIMGSSVVQDFQRLAVDHTREHDFPYLEELSDHLQDTIVGSVAAVFPEAINYQTDESIHQVYPTGNSRTTRLGWHQDDVDDKYLTMSVHLGGAKGYLDFADMINDPKNDKNVPTPQDLKTIFTKETRSLSVAVFACNGLYESDFRNVNRPHSVRVGGGPNGVRHTVQLRAGVNGRKYGNYAVNASSLTKAA